MQEEQLKKKEQKKDDKEPDIAALKTEIAEEIKKDLRMSVSDSIPFLPSNGALKKEIVKELMVGRNLISGPPNNYLNKYIRGSDGWEERGTYQPHQDQGMNKNQGFTGTSQDRRAQGNGRNSQHDDRDLARENSQLRRENNNLKAGSDPNYMYTRGNARCYNCNQRGHLARECRFPTMKTFNGPRRWPSPGQGGNGSWRGNNMGQRQYAGAGAWNGGQDMPQQMQGGPPIQMEQAQQGGPAVQNEAVPHRDPAAQMERVQQSQQTNRME